MAKQEMICPICGGKAHRLVTVRENMPVNQNRLYRDPVEARACVCGDVAMVLCETCGLVWNRAYDDSIDLYDEDYNNCQAASDVFRHYMQSSIRYLMEHYDRSPGKVIEIGCGRAADYLAMIASALGDKTEVIGYDPSCRAASSERIHLYPRYFDVEKENCEDADWLIFRHIIEHFSNPRKLFSNVRGLHRGNPGAVAFFETPDVRWILKNHVVFDFFYEHCSLFSPGVFLRLAEIYDVSVDMIDGRFGGQYLWAMIKTARAGGQAASPESSVEELLRLTEGYTRAEEKTFAFLKDLLEGMRGGRTAIFGAGAKGNTFLNLFDRTGERIAFAIDSNREKSGLYIAGTGHPILPPEAVAEAENIIIMNERYAGEIKAACRGKHVYVLDELCRNAAE